MFENTIAAISTSLQDGAISIIRLSGDHAIEITQKIFDRNIMNAKSHTIHYGFIIDQEKNPVDEVLISIFRAPKTYTREDIVEINCHGGTFITRKILSMVLSAGADLAKPGEFTQRAFYHGRIDLSQAEAVQDMIDASNNTAATMAIHGIKGSVKKLLQPLIDDLMDIIAQIEVNIDYPEYEDVEDMTNDKVLPNIKKFRERLENIIKKSEDSKVIKEGIKVGIIGKPNVGKSSLLNALIEEEKAIVTNIPGTTRDIVEGTIVLGGITLNITDTAGIRESDDLVEMLGVTKSLKIIDSSDLVIFILNNNEELSDEEKELLNKLKDKKKIIVVNKIDLEGKLDKSLLEDYIEISVKENIGIDKIKDRIRKLFNIGELSSNDLTYLSNARTISLLKKSLTIIDSTIKEINDNSPIDIVELGLRDAWNTLGEVIGATYKDELLDELFSRFCLGK